MSSQRPSWLSDFERYARLATSQVVPQTGRCVQCGICSFNCPVGIDVRAYARQNLPIHDSHCLTCGECIARCPRNVLHFGPSGLFTAETG